MDSEDRELGMGRAISRRDFVQGVAAAAVGSGALAGVPSAALAQAGATAADYPPLRSGLRGAHPGAFESAHALRDGETFGAAESTGETYDLVVVGCGLSGLAAAHWYRKQAGPQARILLIDNHDDFGGHAKRNEFVHAGRTYYANGGSAYFDAAPTWTHDAQALVEEMGVDWKNPIQLPRPQPSVALGPATYFNKGYYGRDQLVVGSGIDAPTAAFLARTPLSPQMQAEVLRLYTGTTDYLAGLSKAEKYARLKSISYRDYLLDVAKFSPELLNYTRGVWCLGNDMCTAWFALYRHRPGFAGLGLDAPSGSPEAHDGANYQFICGNSDFARLLVRALIPGTLPPGDWPSLARQRVDYSLLDRAGAPTRIRLSSIVLSAQHVGAMRLYDPDNREVEITYVTGGRLCSVRGKDVIMACNNNIIPYLCPDMPEPQKAALRSAVRAVNQQTNVLFRDWRAWARLGVNRITCPNGFYGAVGLSFPTTLGGLDPVRDPSEPVLVSFSTGINSGVLNNTAMVSDLCDGAPPPPGTPMDDQFRAVRAGMLSKDFAFWERKVRQTAAGALAGGGGDPARDILAVTVNRWPHGFATGRNYLWDGDPGQTSPTVIARQKFGRIAIANSDASGIGMANTAFAEAYRAVNDLQPKYYGLFETF